MRTDFNLSDTGLLDVTGSWQRAATLRETPLQFSAAVGRRPTGPGDQADYGNDKGWRGAVRLSATLTGTPKT